MKSISKRAGDLVMFPFSRVKPSTDQNSSSSIVELKSWHLLYFGSDIIGFYDNRMDLNNSLKEVEEEFVKGSGRVYSKGIIEDSIEEDIFFKSAKILKDNGVLSNVGIDDDDEVIETDLNDPSNEFFAESVLDFFTEPTWMPIRIRIAKAGLGTAKMPADFDPPEKLKMFSPPPQLILERGIDMPQSVYNEMLKAEYKVDYIIDKVCETIASMVRRTLYNWRKND